MRHGFEVLALATLLAGPMATQALPITIAVGVTEWSITECTGTYIECDQVNQVWWGDDSTAFDFSRAYLSGALGSSTLQPDLLFAYSAIFTDRLHVNSWFAAPVNGMSLSIVLDASYSLSRWAQASRVSAVPEPGTLSLLGLGLAALGFSRRRRQPAQV